MEIVSQMFIIYVILRSRGYNNSRGRGGNHGNGQYLIDLINVLLIRRGTTIVGAEGEIMETVCFI